MGGGGGGTGGGRASTSPMAKVTLGSGVAFIATSIALTIVAAHNSADTFRVDRISLMRPHPSPRPEAAGGGFASAPASTRCA